MQHFRRTGFLMKNRLSNIVKSYYGYNLLDYRPSKCASEMGVAPFSSAATGKAATNGFVKREGMKYGSKYVRDGNCVTKVKHEDVGLHLPLKELWSRSILVSSQSLFQPARTSGINSSMFFSARSFASKASESKDQNKSESRKDISTFEDPFDAPTDIIPEKPMTFTEGASYSLIILAGLGVAAAAAYAVLNELILQPKEYKIFGKALKRIQDDGQVRVRIGSPITGYGSESRNRAARQRIPNKIWTDQDNVEHVEVNFYIRGPNGAGKVFSEMFKDKVDGQWKFMFLIVEITSPSRQQLILESYIPA